MSLFNKILSLPDVQARVAQFETQVKKLEIENTSNSNLSGTSRRAADLKKQLEDYIVRVDGIRMKSGEQEAKKKQAIRALSGLQERATKLAGTRRPSSSRQSMEHSSQVAGATAPPTSEIRVEEKKPPMRARAQSIMYDAEASDSDDDDDNSPRNVMVMPTRTIAERAQIMRRNEGGKDSDESTDEGSEGDRQHQRPIQVRGEPAATTSQGNEFAEPDASQSQPIPQRVVAGNRFLVLADFKGNGSSDLAIKKGDVIVVNATRADGWWTAMDTMGHSGLVPKTFLKHFDETEAAPQEHLRRNEPSSMRERPPSPMTRPTIRPPEAPRQQQQQQQHTADVREHRTSSRPTCLGDALSKDVHLTNACHLAPRLSESNLGFHDLYWNFHDDKLRKRRVRMSKFVRLVRLENMPLDKEHTCLIRIALLDQTNRTGRQIVSNVHTIRALSKNGLWTFVPKASDHMESVEFSDFLVRSNYKQQQVVLLIEASIVMIRDDGTAEEKTLGSIKLPLLDTNGECALLSKTYAENLKYEDVFDRGGPPGAPTERKIVLRVLDVPADQVHYVDSLPDVLIFNPLFIQLAFFYRRRCGIVLIRDREDAFSAELISDPILATFPRAADQPDILDYLRKTFNHKMKQIAKKPESEQAAGFVTYYMDTVFAVLETAVLPPYSVWEQNVIKTRRALLDKHAEWLLQKKSSALWLLSQPCRPIDVYALSVDLMGPHALD